MGAIGSNLVTLADVAKTKKTGIGKIAEVMLAENAILKDIPYMEMNEGTIHKESIRSSLPQVYYRKANQAIPSGKTTTEERSFTAAHFESKSQIDEKVASRGGKDRVAFNRWNQAQGHIQANALEHANLLWYGSPSNDPRKVPGLFDIYSTLNTSEPASKQVIDAGGTGSDNMSISLVHWGEQSVFGVYPSGSQAGLKRTDRGLVQISALDELGNPGTFWGFEENFEVDHGLVVKDYRQAVRIANIDKSDLIANNVSAADLIDLMISAAYRIHAPSNGAGVWYMNRTLEAILHKQALSKVGNGGGITFMNYQGEQVMSFLGRPIRRSDALLDSEARVTT